MTNAVLMEYMGFESNTGGRAYAFQVRYGQGDTREYLVTIATDAFSARRVRYQDGPNVCSSKLKRELTDNPDTPTGTSFLITDQELDDYKLRHFGEPSKNPFAAKRRDDL
jgi:hypothetical protein